MTPDQQLVLAFLNNETITQAKTQFQTGLEKTSIEIFDISFRLLKGANIISFEFLIKVRGEKKEAIDSPFGKGHITDFRMYWSPVGFFLFRNDIIEAYILKQFELDYDALVQGNKIRSKIPVKKLSFIANALIGAFSAEAALSILKNKDCSFKANGIDYEIFIHSDGDPQIFVNNKYDVEGDLCVAIYNVKTNILGSNEEYGDTYRRLKTQNIFSMNKFI